MSPLFLFAVVVLLVLFIWLFWWSGRSGRRTAHTTTGAPLAVTPTTTPGTPLSRDHHPDTPRPTMTNGEVVTRRRPTNRQPPNASTEFNWDLPDRELMVIESGGIIQMSSEEAIFPAANCVNGNITDTCQTLNAPDQWINVDLRRPYNMRRVVVTNNATDEQHGWLVGASLHVFNTTGEEVYTATFDEEESVYEFPVHQIDARTVRITSPRPISLSEIQVFVVGR